MEDDEKLIGKLIKKRKQENDAFIKLLGAIESTQNANKKSKSGSEPDKSTKK